MKKIFTIKNWSARLTPHVLIMLMIVFSPVFAIAQERVVTGRVLDNDAEPVPGVNVVVKGTSTGTITDSDGTFSINVNDPNATLVLSFVGYATQEISVGNRTNIRVNLQAEAKNLSEVVITALGVKKEERTLGYSSQEVKGSDLVKAREPNPINSLTGKVAGLTVGASSEMLGSPRILLRGRQDILYVVDGVPVNSDTWNISPDDIESYTVLKGPNAAALYGFRGQNGAIIITTKRGSSKGKGFSVDFNSSTMFDKGFISFPLSQNEFGIGDKYEYAYGNHPLDEDGKFRRAPVWGPRLEGQLVPQWDSPMDPETGKRTGTPFLSKGADNYKNFTETGALVTNNIAFGASTDRADLRLSLSHSHQKGIFPNTKLTIYNFNISSGYDITPKVRFESNFNLNKQTSPNIPDVNYGPNSYAYQFAVYGGAHYDVRDLKDYWLVPGVQQKNVEYGRTNNPYFMAYEWLREHDKTDMYGYAKMTYKINSHLNLNLRTQATTWEAKRTEKFPFSAEVYGRPDRRGDYAEDRRNMFESNNDILLTFDKRVLPTLEVSALLGGNLRYFTYNSSYVRTNNLVIPGVYNFSNTENPLLSYNFNSDMLVLGGYGSLDLTYKRFVTLALTGHLDKLSTLPVGNQGYFYPSAALSTIVSEYVNMPSFITFVKLRGSYANVQGGLTSARVGPSYMAMNTPRPLQYGVDWYTSYDGPNYGNQNSFDISRPYNNAPAVSYSNNLANPDLQPFTVGSYEAGVDMKFLNNRVGLDVTYFTTQDGPQIFQRSVAPSTGHYSKNINDVITNRRGWEVSLKGTPVKSDKFSWNVMVNYATFVERIKEINDPSGVIDAFFKVGDRVDKLYGLKYLRTPEGQIIHNSAGMPVRPPAGNAGMSLLGYGNSDFTWAIQNTFNYNAWTLSFQFDGRVGGKIYNDIMNQGYRGGRDADLVEGAYGDARRKEWESMKQEGKITPAYVGTGVALQSGSIKFDDQGNITNMDELTFIPNEKAASLQDYVIAISDFHEPWMISKTFMKLREVTIGYNLPSKWFQRSFISSATVSLVGRNLLYFAARTDMDMDQYPGPKLSDRFDVYGTRLQSASTRRFGVNLNVKF